MSQSPIVRDIGNGLHALVWIQAIEVPRQADDSWRVQLPVRASLSDAAGIPVTDGHGNEIEVESPLKSINAPFSHYAYHPDVQALYAQLDSVTRRIVTGEIPPQPPVQPVTP